MARKPTYLGLAEVADLLGIPTTAAGMRRRRGKLPAPIAELKMGPLWELAQFKDLLREQKAKGDDDAGFPVSPRRM